MKETIKKRSWILSNSPETTVMDTLFEERKSGTSSPSTIVQISKKDLANELTNAMENLQVANKEIKSLSQFKKKEIRKSLLNYLRNDHDLFKESFKQIVKTILNTKENQLLIKDLITAIDNSERNRFCLVFEGLGQNHLPIGLYELNSNEARRLYGPENLPAFLSDDRVRFSLKFDAFAKKFRIVKSKCLTAEVDGIILR